MIETRRHVQTIRPSTKDAFRLPMSAGGILSPYFPMSGCQETDRCRIILILNIMAVTKVIATAINPSNQNLSVNAQFYNGTVWVNEYNIDIPNSYYTTPENIVQGAIDVILNYAVGAGYSAITSAANIVWPSTGLAAQARSFSTPARALDTAYQPSASKDTLGFWSVSVPCALSLTGGENGAVVLEYADNSGMSTNLVTVGTFRNGNTGTLTLGLNTLQIYGGQISGVIPAGKYFRLRTVDTTGTPTQASVSAEEIQL